MYKRFSINELKTIQNSFVQNLYWVIKKEQCMSSADFFKKIFKEWTDIYYCNRSEISLSCTKTPEDNIIIRDEKEKIEIFLDEEGKREMHNIIKNYIIKKERQTWQKTIEQILMDEFSQWNYNTIDWKPYLVYDIETTIADDVKNAKFLLGYAMYPIEDNKMHYEYIDQSNLQNFVEKMKNFDWYIIWYNNIRFDNPVCIYNLEWDLNENIKTLDIINRKTIDLLVFLYNITGKRLWLNKVATALVGVQKTLESGLEWEVLRKRYKESNDLQALEEFKKYCKNDVRMTALVLLYLLNYKKIFIDGEEKDFSIDEFLEKSRWEFKEEKVEQNRNQILF